MKDKTYTMTIDQAMEGLRIDAALSELTSDISRNHVQKLLMDGHVKVNDMIQTSKKYKVHSGDEIIILLPELKTLDVLPENIPLNIVYEDNDLLVVNKPKGLVVHPAAGNHTGTLVNAILYHCRDLSGINGIIRPGIVHRIDKDTSGLLMIAKNDFAHSSLAAQLKAHSITRIYHAIVYNNFKDTEGTVEAPIGRDPNNRLRMMVTNQNSRSAVTHYKVLETLGNYTYIEARLETGRTHQIRVHMAHINHPLLGDQVYGPKKKILGIESQMLHAKVLGFIHPTTGVYMEFDSDLPEDFVRIINWGREKK